MAGQSTWGKAGASTNSFIVVPRRAKEIYAKAQFKCLVGKINGGRKLAIKQTMFGDRLQNLHIPNGSPIWETTIANGNEERLTMLEDRNEMLGGYGDYPVDSGSYDQFKHARVWINQCDTHANPLPGRCSLKQVKDILSDPKGDLLDGMALNCAKLTDYMWIQALLMGASENLLRTDLGGLGISLYNATAGQSRSSYNFYVPGTGLVTPSLVRATHETAVGTALSTLTDNADYAFNYSEHTRLCDLWSSTIGAKQVELAGKQLRAVVVCDPWLIYRLMKEGGILDNKFREAGPRTLDNPTFDHSDCPIIDNVMYIPYDFMKAYRPSVVSGLPVYGPGLTGNPNTYMSSNTSKICLSVWMGPGAVMRATDRAMNVTAEKTGRHKDTYDYAMHWDDGFVRREWGAEDGRTAMDADACMVTAHYDPGVEVVFNS